MVESSSAWNRTVPDPDGPISRLRRFSSFRAMFDGSLLITLEVVGFSHPVA